MSTPSPAYSTTLRIETPAAVGATSELTATVGAAGGRLTALGVVDSLPGQIVVDVTCDAVDSGHVEQITQAISRLPGTVVRNAADRTFLMHLGGKLEVVPKVPLKDRDDLSRAYTPGVARVCQAIAANPADVRRLTVKRNTVAVVSDGSAVLGLGNIGPDAALPVMEGKAALFKQFANVDAWPLCLDTQDVDQIVEVVRCIAPTFGGINLEDIAAPRCFEVERRLRQLLDIPVFHDDQHGTAIVVAAALGNALTVVGKTLSEARIVLAGLGAAGNAIARLLIAHGAQRIVAFDRSGAVHRERVGLDEFKEQIALQTNAECFDGSLTQGLKGADVFIGVSGPGILTGEDIATMAADAIVFALSNPDPEVDPAAAAEHAAIVATGRSDFPNQINNVLVFPGLFRGLLDTGAVEITDRMLVAAAQAIAGCVAKTELNASYIVPSVFDPAVAGAVADAVATAAGY